MRGEADEIVDGVEDRAWVSGTSVSEEGEEESDDEDDDEGDGDGELSASPSSPPLLIGDDSI